MIQEAKNDKNVLNLDLSEIARTKIWVNGDCTKVLELNLSDMGIIKRLQDAYPKLDELSAEVQNLASAEISDDDVVFAFEKIDKKMRDIVNGIFDFDVCSVCCDGGSMYDPINGQLRFEYIIEKLSNLYEGSMQKEFDKIHKMEAHTAKYTKPNTTTKKRKN